MTGWRREATQATAAVSTPDLPGDTDTTTTTTTTTTSPHIQRGRTQIQCSSPKLAAIIRAGIGTLNESASWIQRSARTQVPLWAAVSTTKEPTLTPRQHYEAHRILDVAHECLDSTALLQQSEYHPLVCSTGDPIALLACRVNVTCTDAIVYWSLPYSVLSQLETVQEQRILEQVMTERLATDRTARLLQQRVQAAAALGQRRRFTVRWELAPAQDVQDYLYSMESDALDLDEEEEDDDEEEEMDEDLEEGDDDDNVILPSTRRSKQPHHQSSYRSKYTS